MRQIFILTVLCTFGFAARADAKKTDWPSYGVMDRAALEAYFTPGLFRTHSPYYDSYGSETLKRFDFVEEDGVTYLYQEGRSLGVIDNLLPSQEHEFSKSVTPQWSFKSRWDDFNKRSVYKQTQDDFQNDANETRIWLSWDNDVRISPSDIEYGTEDKYFDDAMAETNGECCLSHEEYESVTVGSHSTSCAFVAHPVWDVRCYYRHMESGFQWNQFYTRLDEGVS